MAGRTPHLFGLGFTPPPTEETRRAPQTNCHTALDPRSQNETLRVQTQPQPANMPSQVQSQPQPANMPSQVQSQPQPANMPSQVQQNIESDGFCVSTSSLSDSLVVSMSYLRRAASMPLRQLEDAQSDDETRELLRILKNKSLKALFECIPRELFEQCPRIKYENAAYDRAMMTKAMGKSISMARRRFQPITCFENIPSWIRTNVPKLYETPMEPQNGRLDLYVALYTSPGNALYTGIYVCFDGAMFHLAVYPCDQSSSLHLDNDPSVIEEMLFDMGRGSIAFKVVEMSCSTEKKVPTVIIEVPLSSTQMEQVIQVISLVGRGKQLVLPYTTPVQMLWTLLDPNGAANQMALHPAIMALLSRPRVRHSDKLLMNIHKAIMSCRAPAFPWCETRSPLEEMLSTDSSSATVSIIGADESAKRAAHELFPSWRRLHEIVLREMQRRGVDLDNWTGNDDYDDQVDL